MRIKDIMLKIDKEKFIIQKSDGIRVASEVMKKNGLGFVLIYDSDKLIAILTERDLLKNLKDEAFYNKKALDYATKNVITFSENRTIEYILVSMIENSIRRAIISDNSGIVKGVTTIEYAIRYLDEDIYKTNIKINDFRYLSNLITIDCETRVKKVLEFMRENNIGSCAITKNNDLVGIFTERDTVKLINNSVGLEEPIKNYMSSPVIFVDIKTSIIEALDIMKKHNIKRLIVKDNKNYKIIGFKDILNFAKSNYQELIERKLRYSKKILNSISEAIVEIEKIDDKFIVCWANEKANKIFNQSILDKDISKVLDKDIWIEIYSLLVRDKENFSYKIKLNGLIYKISTIIKESIKENIRLIFVDITTLEQVNIKLGKKEQFSTMMRLIKDISHHWRQPLSVISTVATSTIVEKELGVLDDKKLLLNLENINQKAQHISKMLDDFNTFSVSNSKKINIDTNTLINKFLKEISQKIEKYNINIIEDITLLRFDGYEEELLNIFKEIFSNSIDAFEKNNIKNRYFFINLYKNSNDLVITLKDNGGGVDENIMAKIFEPYFTTKHQFSGTGLGLTMVYNSIVNGMNGDIAINNTEYLYQNNILKGLQVSLVIPIL